MWNIMEKLTYINELFSIPIDELKCSDFFNILKINFVST